MIDFEGWWDEDELRKEIFKNGGTEEDLQPADYPQEPELKYLTAEELLNLGVGVRPKVIGAGKKTVARNKKQSKDLG